MMSPTNNDEQREALIRLGRMSPSEQAEAAKQWRLIQTLEDLEDLPLEIATRARPIIEANSPAPSDEHTPQSA